MPARARPRQVDGLVEIPPGSRATYDPADYGFVLDTLGNDGDPRA